MSNVRPLNMGTSSPSALPTAAQSQSKKLAHSLVQFLLEENFANGEYNVGEIFNSWMLMNFNSTNWAAVFCTQGEHSYPKELCTEVRALLLSKMADLVRNQATHDKYALRYAIQHAIAVYAYFHPEDHDGDHMLPRSVNDQWVIAPHDLTLIAQGSALFEEPGNTYYLSLSNEQQHQMAGIGPLILFRGTPPSTANGRYKARIDNFWKGPGYAQWDYIQKEILEKVEASRGRIDVIGHSQGGSLALRAACAIEQALPATRYLSVHADSPGGDALFEHLGKGRSRTKITVYAHKSDVVPTKSGHLPAKARVILGLDKRGPARAHVHIGVPLHGKPKSVTGSKFNQTYLRVPPGKRAVGLLLAGAYGLVLLFHAILSAPQKAFAASCGRAHDKKLSPLQRALWGTAAVMLLTFAMVASQAFMLIITPLHGMFFGAQWAGAVAVGAVPRKYAAILLCLPALALAPLRIMYRHLKMLIMGIEPQTAVRTRTDQRKGAENVGRGHARVRNHHRRQLSLDEL
ncbi:MAG: hypothetical protein ACOYKZ_03990 [Chlamydiia bacterium]